MKASKTLPPVVILAAVLLLYSGWSLGKTYAQQVPLVELAEHILNRPLLQLGNLSLSIALLIKASFFLLFLRLVSRRVRELLRDHVLNRMALDTGQSYAVERGAGYLVMLLGLVVGLQAAGLDLSTLTVLGGAIGIGIGLGLQDIANNFISGLILLFERPVKVGDRVEVGALDGAVVRIGARSTWVRTNDNIVVVLPNSEFITKPVVNWTAAERKVRFSLPVGTSYSSDPNQVREILLGVAAKNPDVLTEPPPDVVFTGFGESSLDFQLRVWTSSKVDMPPVLKSDLYFAVFEALAEAGVEIPFPQRDIHVRTFSAPVSVSNGTAAASTPAVPANPPGNPG